MKTFNKSYALIRWVLLIDIAESLVHLCLQSLITADFVGMAPLRDLNQKLT